MRRMAPPLAGVVCLLCFYLLLLQLVNSHILGVAPEDESYYIGEVIACRDGSKLFSRDRVNDEFCDCPDGTDEPGTSACPESKFYCKNVGDTPQLLFSSRVNDHICDCCDGSDEYDGSISCLNTCITNNKSLMLDTGNDYDSTAVNQIDTYVQRTKSIVSFKDHDLSRNIKGLELIVTVQFLVGLFLLIIFLMYGRLKSRRQQHF